MRLNKHPGAVNHLKIPESVELDNELLNLLFQFPTTFYEHFGKCLQYLSIKQHFYLCNG